MNNAISADKYENNYEQSPQQRSNHYVADLWNRIRSINPS